MQQKIALVCDMFFEKRECNGACTGRLKVQSCKTIVRINVVTEQCQAFVYVVILQRLLFSMTLRSPFCDKLHYKCFQQLQLCYIQV
jgi:hypothetical protein